MALSIAAALALFVAPGAPPPVQPDALRFGADFRPRRASLWRSMPRAPLLVPLATLWTGRFGLLSAVGALPVDGIARCSGATTRTGCIETNQALLGVLWTLPRSRIGLFGGVIAEFRATQRGMRPGAAVIGGVRLPLGLPLRWR